MIEWEGYFESARQRGPNPFYERIEPFLPAGGHALDFGAGLGQGAAWLAQREWTVETVEREPTGIASIREEMKEHPEISLQPVSFLEAELGDYDLVLFVNSVFFAPPEDFADFWPRLIASVRPGGLIGGQLLGPNDDWAKGPTTSHSRAQAEALFGGFESIFWEEVERDGKTIQDQPKHWHIHHLLMKRPSS